MLKKLTWLLFLLPTLLFAETFVQGKDYEVLQLPNTVEKPAKPTVTEFFSYGCPWCFKLEEKVEDWIKSNPGKFDFDRVPVVFNPNWEYYAKAYYTAKSLSILDKMNPALFQAIQVQKQPLNTKDSMTAFFISQGVDEKMVNSAFDHSPTIDLLLKEGKQAMITYQVSGVPAFVVNGKYKTDLQMAQNPDRLIQILNYLVTMNPS